MRFSACVLGLLLLLSQAAQSQYTLEDVAKHGANTDCWTAVDGTVYDLTAYGPDHKTNDIYRLCGIDGTDLFRAQHPVTYLALFVENKGILVLAAATPAPSTKAPVAAVTPAPVVAPSPTAAPVTDAPVAPTPTASPVTDAPIVPTTSAPVVPTAPSPVGGGGGLNMVSLLAIAAVVASIAGAGYYIYLRCF